MKPSLAPAITNSLTRSQIPSLTNTFKIDMKTPNYVNLDTVNLETFLDGGKGTNIIGVKKNYHLL